MVHMALVSFLVSCLANRSIGPKCYTGSARRENRTEFSLDAISNAPFIDISASQRA